MKKLLAMSILLLPLYAAGSARPTADSTVVFRFPAGSDRFYIPMSGNDARLERLYGWVDEYRAEITSGRMPLRVDGYCASLPTEQENRATAYVRANRVKSELITHKGLKEEHLITANHARAYHNDNDVVVVTLRIPASDEPEAYRCEEPTVVAARPEPAEEKAPKPAPAPEPSVKVAPEPQPAPAPKPAVEKAPQPAPAPTPAPEPAPASAAERVPTPAAEASPAAPIASESPAPPYRFAVRTNVLYDALLLPTLGVEWRVNRDIGVKIDGSLAWWSNSSGKVHKMWLLNPEVRWYLLKDKLFYAGVSANYGQYNLYKYALGGLLSKDTGYQGSMWSAGVTVGYRLPLSRRFSVDFNLGLGYSRFAYDAFVVTDGNRMSKERDCTKNFWGPTQAGITLVWTIGSNK